MWLAVVDTALHMNTIMSTIGNKVSKPNISFRVLVMMVLCA